MVALVFGGRRARVPLAVAAVVGVFAMGEELRVDGRATGIALPWRLLAGLPGFEHVIPSRLSLFTAGLVGAGLAFAVTALRAPAARAVATILVLAAVLPLTPARLPGVDARAVPAFFTAPAARMCPGGSVLVLPFPAPDTTEPMRWQAASGMAFAMPGGYFIGPAVDGRAYVGGQPTPTGLLLRAVQLDGQVRAPTPLLRSTFAHDVRRWRACAAVLGPAPQADALRAQVTALVGREPESTGGVLLWRRSVATGQSGSSSTSSSRTGSVSGWMIVRTTRTMSSTTTASRNTAAPRNQSGGRPLLAGVEVVVHARRPEERVDRHPGQQEPPPRQREHGQRHQPQRVLRAPHLVDQQERRPRAGTPARRAGAGGARGSPARPRPRTPAPCSTATTALSTRRGLAVGERAVEARPAGEVADHEVQRVRVGGPRLVEPEELPPPHRPGQRDRQVHRDPREHRADDGGHGHAELPPSQPEDQDRQ